MILTLIGTGLLVLSVIGFILYVNDVFSYNVGEIISIFGCIIGSIGFVWLLVCTTFIIVPNCNVENTIRNENLKRESIVKQIEAINSDYEDVSKAEVISNVYDWNRHVLNEKYWSSNPWTSWFYNQKVVDSLECIELED